MCVEPASPLKSNIVRLLITQENVFCRMGENEYQFNPVKVGDVFSCLHYTPVFNEWNNSHKNAPGPLISFVATEKFITVWGIIAILSELVHF